MRPLSTNRMLNPSRLFFLLGALICAVVGMARPVRAQEKATSALPACVPSDLTALIVPEGSAVRVHEVKQEPGGKRSPARATPGSEPEPRPTEFLERKRAYQILWKEAQHGNAAAMVNLAASSLAGWGTKPNAGAALYWLHAAADRGYGAALYDLGILYFNGCGVPQDPAEAFHFFDLGARAGYLAAQVNLGYFYDRGLGVAEDRLAAAHWYLEAAKRGEARAQYNLGDLFLHGEGVPKDESEAFAWFQKAALQGHTGAQIMIGSMLAAGRGGSRDLVAAYFWIFTASLDGDDRAAPMLQVLDRQLSSEQIEQAKSRAQLRLAGLQAAKN
jgi:TPR repeat protein